MKKYGEAVFGTVTESAPVAETTHGKIKGENRDGIAIFRGIPYGGSCSGEWRFLPSEPAADWEGIRDCTKNGYYSWQFGTSISGSDFFGDYFSGGHQELFGVKEEKQGEDCLVLNVLTPGLDDKKRPVLVYIHGGGFATGSGTLVLGADKWAREEDLVVVGINHRLNIFGYLYLGGLDETYAESGMAGMLDLVLALKWVQENISAFGGDPAQVTIMGESGGGMKVSMLMAMPEAKGLFSKAIVESGSNTVGHYSRESAAKITEHVLEALHLSKENWKEILSIPAEELLKASVSTGNDPLTFMPVADEIHLNYQESSEIQAFETSKEIPLLVGASEDEMGVFMPVDKLDITWENLKEKLLEAAEGRGPLQGELVTEENVDKVIEIFKELNKKQDSALQTFVKIKSLGSFLGGGAWFQAVAKAEQKGAPVYQYLVSYDTPNLACPEVKLAWHTADLPLQMRIVFHPEAEKLSVFMAHSWAAFARTGNPSTEQIEWPAFEPESGKVLVIDEEPKVQTDPLKKIREVLYGKN
ncbi:MAG: carboxylesterase/lipase family protein [Lachnospiraceae bacterium]